MAHKAGCFQSWPKALTHVGIQRRVFGEVLFVSQLFKPEVGDGLGLHV